MPVALKLEMKRCVEGSSHQLATIAAISGSERSRWTCASIEARSGDSAPNSVRSRSIVPCSGCPLPSAARSLSSGSGGCSAMRTPSPSTRKKPGCRRGRRAAREEGASPPPLAVVTDAERPSARGHYERHRIHAVHRQVAGFHDVFRRPKRDDQSDDLEDHERPDDVEGDDE